jgi:hypothetical protein
MTTWRQKRMQTDGVHTPDLTKRPDKLIGLIKTHVDKELRNNVAKIEIGKDFFEDYNLFQITTYTENDWFYIADAKVKLVPYKGVKSAHIVKLSKLVTSFMVVYSNETMSSIKAVLDIDTQKIDVINLPEVIIAINASICATCKRTNRKCVCNSVNDLSRRLSKEELEVLQVSNLKLSDYVEITATGEILQTEQHEAQAEKQVDVSKFQPLLQSLAKTMRIKSTSQMALYAQSLLKANPNITEPELAKELLKMQF